MPYIKASPWGAGIARFVTDCFISFESKMIASFKAFPPGGRRRRTATDEGQLHERIAVNCLKIQIKALYQGFPPGGSSAA